MSQEADQIAYYNETITINLDRLTLAAICSAAILALQHPEIPDDVSAIVTYAMRNLTPMVDKYAPANVRTSWARALKAS